MSLTFGGSGSSFQSTDGDLRTNYPIVSNGQLLSSSFASYDVLPPGTNGQVLSRNSAQPLGLEWVTGGGGGGEANIGANIGTGQGTVYHSKVLDSLYFKTIKAGNGINVTNLTNEIELSVGNLVITDVYVVVDIPARDALTVQTGDVAKVTSNSKTYIYDGSVWIEVSSTDHTSLTNIGTNTHAQIDTHIGDVTKHRQINDAGSSVTDLWSASKINTTLQGIEGSGTFSLQCVSQNPSGAVRTICNFGSDGKSSPADPSITFPYNVEIIGHSVSMLYTSTLLINSPENLKFTVYKSGVGTISSVASATISLPTQLTISYTDNGTHPYKYVDLSATPISISRGERLYYVVDRSNALGQTGQDFICVLFCRIPSLNGTLPHQLGNLDDITLSTPSANQTLARNGANNTWVNKNIVGTTDSLTVNHTDSNITLNCPKIANNKIHVSNNLTDWNVEDVGGSLEFNGGGTSRFSVPINSTDVIGVPSNSNTRGMRAPYGTTSQRLSAQIGVYRVNSTLGNIFEYYNGTTWVDLTQTGGASALTGLSDTNITAPVFGANLRWDGISKWEDYKYSITSDGVGTSIIKTHDYDTILRKLKAGSNMTLSLDGDDIKFDATVGASNLDGLTDVTISTPATAELLSYSTFTSQWSNQPLAVSNGANGDQNLLSVTALTITSKSLKAGSNVNFTGSDSGQVTINSSAGATNLDALTDVDLTTTAPILGDVLAYTTFGNKWVPVAPVDTQNLGAGQGLLSHQLTTVKAKSLVAGTNITMSSDSNTVTINSTGGGSAPRVFHMQGNATGQTPINYYPTHTDLNITPTAIVNEFGTSFANISTPGRITFTEAGTYRVEYIHRYSCNFSPPAGVGYFYSKMFINGVENDRMNSNVRVGNGDDVDFGFANGEAGKTDSIHAFSIGDYLTGHIFIYNITISNLAFLGQICITKMS